MSEFADIEQDALEIRETRAVDHHGSGGPGGRIAVVTDSTADLPDAMAEKLGISIVPNIIVINGKSLLDGKDISREEFYESLPKMKVLPTTGTASSGVYHQLYTRLLEGGYQWILSIHTSSLLSGIINAASTAAQDFGHQVRVFDSGSVTMGLGLQVLTVAEALVKGGQSLTVDSALNLLEDLRKRVRVIGMLDTLEYIRRSGRVSWSKARLGDLLNIKPFIDVRDGHVLSLGEARTFRKGAARLMQILRDLGPPARLAILHTNAEAEARRFMEEYGAGPEAEPLIVNLTTAIGAHVGPGALGFAAIVK